MSDVPIKPQPPVIKRQLGVSSEESFLSEELGVRSEEFFESGELGEGIRVSPSAI